MNQIQNWFINSRKRFLGPLKSKSRDSNSVRKEEMHKKLGQKNGAFKPSKTLADNLAVPSTSISYPIHQLPITNHVNMFNSFPGF